MYKDQHLILRDSIKFYIIASCKIYLVFAVFLLLIAASFWEDSGNALHVKTAQVLAITCSPILGPFLPSTCSGLINWQAALLLSALLMGSVILDLIFKEKGTQYIYKLSILMWFGSGVVNLFCGVA